MSNEIDRLEIAVEAEANKANRALSGMEKRLNKIADGLEKVVALTAGLDKIGNLDFSGMEKFKKEIDSIFQTQKKMSRASRGPRINRSDLKYTEKSLDDIYEKFKEIGKGIDLTGMGLPELQRRLKDAESQAKRLNDRLEKKIAMEGTDKLGKSWESLVYDIQKATNEAEGYREAIDKIKKEVPNLKISRGEDISSPNIDNAENRSSYVSPESLNYDPDAMRMVFGEGAEDLKNFNDVMDRFKVNASEAGNAINNFEGSMDTEKVNTYEAQIKRLRAELSDLASQGFKQGDAEYDNVAKELARVTAEKKKYDKAMKDSAETDVGLKKTDKSLKSIRKDLKSVKNEFSKMGKTAANAFKGAANTLGKMKKLLTGTQKQANKGMSWGRMIGSSVAFSFVFQGISMIQNAIKEGSDNLAQYSAEYNKSISSMVTALLYMKNAWAAAFAPIVNVVAPYIDAFISMIARALNAVGQFMAALTGSGFVVQSKKVWKDYAAGLGDVSSGADNAAKSVKDLKNYTLGIDELNVIQPSESSSGGSGSSGSGGTSDIDPSDMFETIEVSASMNKLAEIFKQAIKTSDFSEIGSMISDKLSDTLESINWKKVYKKAEGFGKGLATFLNGLITPRLFYDLGEAVANSINTAFQGANAFAMNFDWDNLGESLAKSIKGFFENWDAGLTAETFSNFVEGILSAITRFVTTLDEDDTFEEIGQKLVDFICGIDWAGLVWDLAEFFIALTDALIDIPNDFGRGVGQAIIDKIFGEDSGIEMPEIALPPTSLLGLSAQFGEIKNWAIETANGIAQHFENGWEKTKKAWENGEGFFWGVWEGITYVFQPVKEFFGEKFDSAFRKIQDIFQPLNLWFSEKWSAVKSIFDKDKVKNFFKSGFKSAYKAVTDVWNGLGDFFKGIANTAIKPIGKMVNGIIDGINWVSNKLGVGNVLSNWDVPKFARGTDGVPQNTIGVVNDQKGATYKELVMLPNGKSFVPEGRNVMLPLPKGTKIMPAGQTKDFMSGFPHFAGGIGDFFKGAWESIKDIAGSIWDYATHPEKILQIAINKFVDLTSMFEPWTTIAGGAIKKLFDSAVQFIKNLFDTAIPEIDYNPSSGVEQWRGLAKKALQMTNQYSDANLKLLLYQMQTESGGNPKAINNWDINAKNGTPSKGLMQVIDPTFKANAFPGYDKDIWDPLSNMLAAIRYTVGRYGSLANGWKGHGYATGGFPRMGEMFFARERGPELVGKIGNRNAVVNNDQIVASVSAGVAKALVGGNDRIEALLAQILDYQERLLQKDTSLNVDGKRMDKQLSKARRNTGYNFGTT